LNRNYVKASGSISTIYKKTPDTINELKEPAHNNNGDELAEKAPGLKAVCQLFKSRKSFI
jgi:hypothetical protein